MLSQRRGVFGSAVFAVLIGSSTIQLAADDFTFTTAICASRTPGGRPLILAHRRNVRASISAALERGADGVEVDVRLHRGDLVLAHDPVVADDGDVVRLHELYERPHESLLVYLDFKDDAVSTVAEQIHLRGAFHRFVFFAERRDIVRSLAATKRRFPDLVANVSLLNVDVPEIEAWFEGLPDYVQIYLWTSAATRAYLASRTALAFDTMLNLDLLPPLDPALGGWARRSLRPFALIQTDFPERFASSCAQPTDWRARLDVRKAREFGRDVG